MDRKLFLLIGLLALSALALTACGGSAAPAVEPSEVLFDVELIEVKGATDGIPAPEVDPESLSAGYRFTAPGDYDAENSEKWQVSTYMFNPAAMSVFQNDEVTLRLFGVNGDEHILTLVAPDGSTVASDTINRGREIDLSFTADQAGYYKLICANHSPTMQAPIQVVPAG